MRGRTAGPLSRWVLALCAALLLALPGRAWADTYEVKVDELGIAADEVEMSEEGGYARVARTDEDGSKWFGLYSRTGEALFPYAASDNEYEYADGVVTRYSSAARPAMSDNMGYYTIGGSELFAGSGSLGDACGYNVASPYGEGVAVVRSYSGNMLRDVRTRLIDKQGDVVLDLGGPFTRGIAFGEGMGGNPPSVTSWAGAAAGFVGSARFSCGLIPFYSQCAEDAALAVGQNVSEFVMPEEFNKTYNNGFQSRCGYMDRYGNVVIGMDYASALSFSSDGLARVAGFTDGGRMGKYGYIDTTGSLVVPYRFDNGCPFYGGLSCVRENGAWGVIDRQGNTVLPFEYDDAWGTGDESLCTLSRDGKYGLVSAQDGKVAVPFEWDELTVFRGGYAYGIKNGLLHAITVDRHGEPATSGVCGTCEWSIDDEGVLFIGSGELASNDTGAEDFWPWYPYRERIEWVQDMREYSREIPGGREEGFEDSQIRLGASIAHMFDGCSQLQGVTLRGGYMFFADCWDTSAVVDASCLFRGCSSLVVVDLSNLGAKGTLINTTRCFEGCERVSDWTVSASYDTSREGAVPTAKASNGKWFSKQAEDWFDAAHIAAQRSGVADAYHSYPTTNEMHRLYNPNSGEHLYTASDAERDDLVSKGWDYEGVAWNAPKKSDTPVWRLYNPNEPLGDHHYTTDRDEYDHLVSVGWSGEGIGWYSHDLDRGAVPLYRLYNPNAYAMGMAGAHHYTKSASERDELIWSGWQDEQVGWYGTSVGKG